VHINKVEAGLRSRAAPEGNASTALALVTFSVTPSAESMTAELLRRRAMSVSFASGVLSAMERGHVDPHMVPLSASELLAEDHVACGAGDNWREIEAGGVGLGTSAGGAVAARGRGSRGEGIVGRVKCVQYGLDDVDDLGCCALHWAALNDRLGVMKMLLQVELNRIESNRIESKLIEAALIESDLISPWCSAAHPKTLRRTRGRRRCTGRRSRGTSALLISSAGAAKES